MELAEAKLFSTCWEPLPQACVCDLWDGPHPLSPPAPQSVPIEPWPLQGSSFFKGWLAHRKRGLRPSSGFIATDFATQLSGTGWQTEG
jgi:hypothetical protein